MELNSFIYFYKLGLDKSSQLKKLQEWGLILEDGLFPCPSCKGAMQISPDASRQDGFYWRCINANVNSLKMKKKAVPCRQRISIRSKTFFEGSHLEIWQILGFVVGWVHNVDSAFNCINVDICKQTAVDWSSFCREVVYNAFVEHGEPIGGEGKIVEIDESKFGRRKYYRGHSVEGQWVFGGIERESGRVFMVPVEKRDRATLLPIIKQWIKPGSIIMSDFWKPYDILGEEGYHHLKVNHSLTFKDFETGACTNAIESSWRHAKASLPTYNRKKSFFRGQLAKYMFQKSCRISDSCPTVQFFKHAGKLYSPLNANAVNDLQAEAESDEN